MQYPWHNPAVWHAMNVHLPIVLVVLGLPALCVVAITRGRHRALRWGTLALYAAATVSAWFAAETGERAMHELPPTITAAAAERINFHEWMAQWVWVLCAVTTGLLLLANVPRRWARQTFTTLALVFSVAAVGWVSVTAHSGGLAVYEHGVGTIAMRPSADAPALASSGSTATEPARPHATSAPAVAVTAAPAVGAAPAVAAPAVAAPTVAPTVPSVAIVSYTQQVRPLLHTKCAECHSGKEIKGEFDVSSVAAMTRGGKKAGAGIVAGKPDDSAIVQYIEGTKQPRMPKGGVAMKPADVALIRGWIAGGAVDDSGVTTTVVSLPANPNPAPAVVQPTPAPVAIEAVPAPAPAPSTPAPSAPATQALVSEDWDPQVKFNPAESIAVRRFVRLKNLPPAPAPPTVKEPVFNVIDQFVIAKWKDDPRKPDAKSQATTGASTQATQPAAPTTREALGLCDDSTFVRRAYLDLIGLIPTADEARKFVEDTDEKKREKLIDALLARTREYAGHWVPFWEDALMSNGLHQGGVGTHGNYRQWIYESFYDNKAYDVMVQELLDPTMPSHPPRFVLNDNHERTLQSASNTAQVFLGTAIKCASCHSHFLNDEWPQARATAFSGFFAAKDLELVRCERSSGEFVKTHFMFDLPKAPTSAPAEPKERLRRVAQLITDPTNPRFARTMVNRLWKRYTGLGLFEPADDYREDTPASHPELLDYLSDDFIRHGYDVKRTIRLILTSRAYQMRYDPQLEDKFDVEKPKDPRYFRSPALRRLTAEQVFDSIAVAMNQKTPEKRAYQDDKSSPLTRSLGKPAARNEVSTQRPDDTAIVQALELLNGQEWHDRVYKGDLVSGSAVQPNIEQIVEDVYWSAFSRAPSAKEKVAGVEFIKAAPPPASTQPVEMVFVEDAIPTRATPAGLWKFVTAPDHPVFSGKSSHKEAEDVFPANVQHLFSGTKFPVAPQDTLFTYVYVDKDAPPKELMIQFNYAGQWRRASWGENAMPAPFNPKTNFGAVPKGGEWVRLEIPAAKIGIDKPGLIGGISFDQIGGKPLYWDKTGAMKGPPIHDPAAIGDMLWALITSPEFQYVK